MSDDLEARISALESENARLREELSARNVVAARALASQQQRSLQVETIRRQKDELQALAEELARAKLAEEQKGIENIELIRRQESMIRALSTPILQIWSGVLALPLIGKIDAARSVHLLPALLEHIGRTGVRYAIVDVTGVDEIDETSADHLVRIVRAVQLLGVKGMITGIRPVVAHTLISLGFDLSRVVTFANLQQGLVRCIREMNRTRGMPEPARRPQGFTDRGDPRRST